MSLEINELESYIAGDCTIAEGKRNDTLYKIGLRCRKKNGLEGLGLLQFLRHVNSTKCVPPLRDSEVETIAASVAKSKIPIDPIPRSTDEFLDKEISFFTSATTATPSGRLTIRQFINDCKNGKYREQVESIRSEQDKEQRSLLKKRLPAVTIQSEVCERRSQEYCKNNGIICLDFDSIEDVESAKDAIAALPYIFAVGISAGGQGLFALAALAKPTMNLKVLLTKIQKDIEFTIDKACSDASRLRYATYDPGMIVKENVIPFRKRKRSPSAKIGIDILDSFLKKISTVNFSESEGEKVKSNVYYIMSIDDLLESVKKYGLDFGIKNETPYVYNGRYWQFVEWKIFQQFLQEAGRLQGIPYKIIKDHKFVKNLVEQFVSEARFPIVAAKDVPKINLRNGTLHFTSDGTELKSFSKEDGLTYQLSYDFDPSAEAPIFKKFLDHVLPDMALQKLVFQYVGYVFLRNMNLEKVLFLYGDGSNGKSVLLNVIRGLVGHEQSCGYSLEDITQNPASRAELGKHLLNVCTEISGRMSISIFKKIASREPLSVNPKYKDPYTMHDYATSIFSANKLPMITEQTGAFFRRFIIVPFSVHIPEHEQDRELASKIIGNEMSGVWNRVVEGVASVLAIGKFEIPTSVQAMVDDFRTESDTVLLYMEGYRPSSSEWILFSELYSYYKLDYPEGVTRQVFSQRLRTLGYEIKKKGRGNTRFVNAERQED